MLRPRLWPQSQTQLASISESICKLMQRATGTFCRCDSFQQRLPHTSASGPGLGTLWFPFCFSTRLKSTSSNWRTSVNCLWIWHFVPAAQAYGKCYMEHAVCHIPYIWATCPVRVAIARFQVNPLKPLIEPEVNRISVSHNKLICPYVSLVYHLS